MIHKYIQIYNLLQIIIVTRTIVTADIDFNDINPDGSFQFRHSNDDIGSYYHSATKSGDQIIRGRYGSRNPSNGRIEETVYSAGPRGYRARGPQVHRKMDLNQYPLGPVGSPDDPLADPFDDPSYNFNFKTSEYERSEKADSSGRVNGLYSFLDDVGEKHTVRYAAGAETGFEVSNAVPDSPGIVAYSNPLYKAPRGTRGRMSVRRGPGGQYDFILSAPDHRRSETSGPDGIVRGSYSYLDDKGMQRTVQYIAGAGIGYRVLQNTIGFGTHLNPRPALPAFGVKDFQSNDLDNEGFSRPTGSFSKPNRPLFSSNDDTNDKEIQIPNRPSITTTQKKPYNEYSRDEENIKTGDPFYGSSDILDRNKESNSDKSKVPSNEYLPPNRRKDTDKDDGYFYPKGNFGNRGNVKYSHKNKEHVDNNEDGNIYNSDVYNQAPYVTNDRNQLSINRNRDWSLRSQDSTIVKNVGRWFVNLPPGQSVRAHVQNIDLLPLGGRIPSPSEALRRDELKGN